MKHQPNRTRMPLTLSVMDRFLPNIDRSGDCWLWIGKVDKDGYGVFYANGGDFRAHRVAYEFAFDVAPENQCVCHRCDNPQCVRPEHLFLGTNQENTADRHAKGRSAVGDRTCARMYPERLARGERSGSAKLTETDVRAIRAALEHGASYAALGRQYGVTWSAIKWIHIGRTWRHLT